MKITSAALLLLFLCSCHSFKTQNQSQTQTQDQIQSLDQVPEEEEFSRNEKLLGKGIILAQKGFYQIGQNQFNVAIGLLNESTAIFKEIERWDLYVNNYGLLARCYLQLGQLDKIEQLNSEALALTQQHQLDSILYVQYYFIQGSLCHERGQYKDASNNFNYALSFENKNIPLILQDGSQLDDSKARPIKSGAFGHAYNYAGLSLMAQGQFQIAIDYLNKAIRLYKIAQSEMDIITSRVNLGDAHRLSGEVDKAIEIYEQIIEQIEPINKYIPALAIAINNTSKCYRSKKDFETEHYYLKKLSGVLKNPKIDKLLSQSGTSLRVARLSLQGELALNHANRNLKSEALILAKSAMDSLENVQNDIEVVSGIYADIGHTYLHFTAIEAALLAFQSGLKTIVPELDATDNFTNPTADAMIVKLNGLKLLKGKINTLLLASKTVEASDKQRYLKAALATATLSVEVLEEMRSNLVQATMGNLQKENSLLDLDKKYSVFFDLNVEIAYQLYQETGQEEYMGAAFTAAEKSKAYILRQALDRVEQFKGFPTEALNKIRQLEGDIYSIERRIIVAQNKNQQDQIDALEDDCLNKRKEYQHLIENLSSNPETARFYQDQYQPITTTLSDIQQTLSNQEGQAVLEIYESEQNVYTFFITKNQTVFTESTKPSHWVADIEWLNYMHTNLNLASNEQLIQQYTYTSHQLYQTLFGNVLDHQKNDFHRLVIIPHGNTHQINFQLLLKSPQVPQFYKVASLGYEMADCSDFDFLLKSYALSYAASGTIFSNELQKARPANDYDYTLLGFAPDYSYRNAIARKNGTLPYGLLKDEFVEIEKLLPAEQVKIIRGDLASEKAFRDLVDKYSTYILHISAHGIINDDFPELSKIIFSAQRDSTDGYDNDLEVGEIYQIFIETQLAILSACKTGGGKLAGGAGKINLARSFAYAHCPGIIMSLWDLNEASNLSIMNNLYPQLFDYDNPVPIDVALQQAQLAYLTQQLNISKTASAQDSPDAAHQLELLHPYYWGGLVSIGRTDQLNLN